ncbi:unnamed protein product [Cylindrotheca closterium]|uniref:Uncharacterized protein n=1 Tax=Cylindrotheca closterium TaxID=2856 RepID=A0AAD2CEE2_9STRA|nr:unnamed protein product [Cylindrotheca closterium]
MSKEASVDHFNRSWKEFTRTMDPMNAYKHSYKLNVDVCGAAFMSVVRKFKLLESSLNLDPEKIKSELCLFHFTPPPYKATEYKSVVENNTTITRQMDYGEDKSKIAARSPHPFFRGRLKTPEDFHVTMANFLKFVCFLKKDFNYKEMPFLVECLLSFAKILTQNAAKAWLCKHHLNADLMVLILNDAMTIFSSAATTASTSHFVPKVNGFKPLPGAIFDTIAMATSSAKNQLTSAIHSGNLLHYSVELPVMCLLCPSASKSKEQGAATCKRDFPSSEDSNPERKRNKTDANDAPGLIRWTRPGRPEQPVPPIELMHPRLNRMTTLCGHFCHVGRRCRRRRDSPLIHLPSPNTLPVNLQRDLKQWADNNPNVELTHALTG